MATCEHCGKERHEAGYCLRVQAREYYPDGVLKRVEYYQIRPEIHHHASSISTDDGRMTKSEWQREHMRVRA